MSSRSIACGATATPERQRSPSILPIRNGSSGSPRPKTAREVLAGYLLFTIVASLASAAIAISLQDSIEALLRPLQRSREAPLLPVPRMTGSALEPNLPRSLPRIAAAADIEA